MAGERRRHVCQSAHFLSHNGSIGIIWREATLMNRVCCTFQNVDSSSSWLIRKTAGCFGLNKVEETAILVDSPALKDAMAT
jgi:hypothetical protein